MLGALVARVIRGIGVDLCSIERMRCSIANERFVEKIFHPEEAAYARERADPARHFASAFAAKEALAKAGGWGMLKLGLRNTWVTRANGAPAFSFSPHADEWLRAQGIEHCWLSLTHEGDFACAFVVLEGEMCDA